MYEIITGNFNRKKPSLIFLIDFFFFTAFEKSHQSSHFGLEQKIVKEKMRPNLIDADCDQYLKDIMIQGWEEESERRPSFEKIITLIKAGRKKDPNDESDGKNNPFQKKIEM